MSASFLDSQIAAPALKGLTAFEQTLEQGAALHGYKSKGFSLDPLGI